MLTLYRHVLTVEILTAEESPDRLIEQAEDLLSRVSPGPYVHVTATVEPAARAATPYMRVPARPRQEDFSDVHDYWSALDSWTDQLPPTVPWREDGKA